MARPAVDEALALLAERFPEAPPVDDDLTRAWSGGMRGVADAHVVEAARTWAGPAFPKLTEFLLHLGEVSNSPRSAPPPPSSPSQAQLSGLSRKERSKERIAEIRAQLEAGIAERRRADTERRVEDLTNRAAG